LFYVNSLILKPGKEITDLKQLKQKRNDYFVAIGNADELIGMKSEIDFHYIHGAIELIDLDSDQILLDVDAWDLVDQLWGYLLDVMEQVVKTGEGETLFPDQPVKLSIQSISKDWVLYRLQANDKVEAVLPKKAFLEALLDGAEMFFQTMTECFKEQCDYQYELNQIHTLRGILNQ
jgi:hypothetical protein